MVFKLKAFDKKYLNKKVKYLAGVDEAGRGPLAGPVVAAAVVFSKNTFIKGVNDSKQLTENQREKLFDKIIFKALSYSVSIIDHNVIDEVNILNATMLAMKQAVDGLNIQPDQLASVGNRLPHVVEAVGDDFAHLRVHVEWVAVDVVDQRFLLHEALYSARIALAASFQPASLKASISRRQPPVARSTRGDHSIEPRPE